MLIWYPSKNPVKTTAIFLPYIFGLVQGRNKDIPGLSVACSQYPTSTLATPSPMAARPGILFPWIFHVLHQGLQTGKLMLAQPLVDESRGGWGAQTQAVRGLLTFCIPCGTMGGFSGPALPFQDAFKLQMRGCQRAQQSAIRESHFVPGISLPQANCSLGEIHALFFSFNF